ncbi:MAG: thiosulfate oxidation carrier protein SoxY [Magnetospirillum sp.]|nr:thiosulfate oxidation carrier protein SoxY [Magnetospirillum sp.]
MSETEFRQPTLSRRHILLGTAAVGLMALPRWAAATPAEAEAVVAKLAGSAKPAASRIALQLPQIAENGNSVQFSVSVDSPMTETDYVKSIHIIADQNPYPEVATFYLSPANGKAEVTMRMRLAKTQNVRAIALMSDGSVHQAQQEVKVTIGGCGG